MTVRIVAAFALLAAAFLVPWFAALPLGVLLAFRFPRFYESVAVFFLLDSLMSAPSPHFASFRFVATALMLILLLAVEWLKRRMVLYR